MQTADTIIAKLGLTPHIEGGYFTETYTSPYMVDGKAINERIEGERPTCSTIYYLLKSGQVSQFHRLKFDEQWFFHRGSSLRLHLINQDGSLEVVTLGPEIGDHEAPRFLIKAGVVLGAEVIEDDSFCLVSCVVSPGFDYRDFTLFESRELTEEFPQHEALIKRFNG